MYLNFHTHILKNDPEVINFYNVDIRKGAVEFTKGDFRCAGIHPWWIERKHLENRDYFKKFFLESDFLCMGEMGLDRSFKSTSFETQEEVFKFQLEIASLREDSFIIIHCVKAYQEILNCVRDSGFKGHLVFHDYNGSEEMTQKLVERGDYFSYGSMLFRENSKAMKSLSLIPNNRLFIETDDQQEFSIFDAYKRASTLLSMDLKDLADQCMKNFLRIKG